jgi:hypothetical protein
MSSSSPSRAALFSAPVRSIALAGWVLVVLFLTLLSASLVPLRLLDPAWQLQVGAALINASPFPLIALVLLRLASSLDPRDEQLENRGRLAAQLAVVAALGYLLLMPLLATASLQNQQIQSQSTNHRLRQATGQLQQMRTVLREANTTAELEQRLAALQGPRLDANDRRLPLPLLRSRVEALLDQADAQLARARSAAKPASPWALLDVIARTTVASLALATGFSGLALRPGSEPSVLEECNAAWSRLRRRRSSARGQGGRRESTAAYLRQISEGKD